MACGDRTSFICDSRAGARLRRCAAGLFVAIFSSAVEARAVGLLVLTRGVFVGLCLRLSGFSGGHCLSVVRACFDWAQDNGDRWENVLEANIKADNIHR